MSTEIKCLTFSPKKYYSDFAACLINVVIFSEMFLYSNTNNAISPLVKSGGVTPYKEKTCSLLGEREEQILQIDST